MPTVDNNCKVTSQTLKLTLVWYIFKLLLYFNYIIISNQNKSYLAINRGSVLQIRYGFYRHALQIHYQPWWLVIEREAWSSNKVAFGTWMFGDSWRKFIKALLLHKISFFFGQEELRLWTPRAVTGICIWLPGQVHWHRALPSVIITKSCRNFKEGLHSS